MLLEREREIKDKTQKTRAEKFNIEGLTATGNERVMERENEVKEKILNLKKMISGKQRLNTD